MAQFKVVVDAYVASRELDQASLSRLAFWVDVLGEKEIAAISADDIDMAMVRLAERGRLKAGRGISTAASGKPLAGSTINRYLTQAGSIFKHAKRLKLLPRSFIAPTRGIERSGDFMCEEAVREAVAAVRAMYATVSEAEGSDEWRALRPRVARWVLRTSLGLGSVRPEDHAWRIAEVYLTAPHYLPMLPPEGVEDDEDEAQ